MASVCFWYGHITPSIVQRAVQPHAKARQGIISPSGVQLRASICVSGIGWTGHNAHFVQKRPANGPDNGVARHFGVHAFVLDLSGSGHDPFRGQIRKPGLLRICQDRATAARYLFT